MHDFNLAEGLSCGGMKAPALLTAALLLFVSIAFANSSDVTPAQRAASLLARMTLADKIGLMHGVSSPGYTGTCAAAGTFVFLLPVLVYVCVRMFLPRVRAYVFAPFGRCHRSEPRPVDPRTASQ